HHACEPRGDDRDAPSGLHTERAGSGLLGVPDRHPLRAPECDDPDAHDDRAPLRLDARRLRSRRNRLRLAGHRALRRERRRLVRLPADHGRDPLARHEFHAGEPPRGPRLRLARSSDPPAEHRVTTRVLSFRPLAGWFDERRSSTRELRRYVRIFARSASSVTGLVLVLAFLAIAAIGPWIVPYPEDARGAVHLDRKLGAPSAAHWFGTDEVGNDVFTRVILGARVSLQIGLIITLVAATIGVPLGVVA